MQGLTTYIDTGHWHLQVWGLSWPTEAYKNLVKTRLIIKRTPTNFTSFFLKVFNKGFYIYEFANPYKKVFFSPNMKKLSSFAKRGSLHLNAGEGNHRGPTRIHNQFPLLEMMTHLHEEGFSEGLANHWVQALQAEWESISESLWAPLPRPLLWLPVPWHYWSRCPGQYQVRCSLNRSFQ